MDGFLSVIKPPGMSSGDVVLFIRKLLPRGVKVGHGGTLDPEAAGVLPVCIGRGTRLFDYVIDKEKEYIAELWLGVRTDTQDATGEILAELSVQVDATAVRDVLYSFEGRILQTPPVFSALKVDGRRLYERARKGESVEIAPREVVVHEIEYLGQTDHCAHRLRVLCGKGVYIRTLLNDIGERLGCHGMMSFLLRSKAGIFTLENSYTLDELREADLCALLFSLDAPLSGYRAVRAPETSRRLMTNGGIVKGTYVPKDLTPGEIVRLYCGDDFFGMGELREHGEIRFRAMLGMVK